MKIIIVALSTGNAMGQYLEAFLPELSKISKVVLIAPQKNKLNIEGVDIKYVNTGQGKIDGIINFINYFSVDKINKIIKSISPSIVHIFNSEGYPWNIFISGFCKKNNIPVITTIHDPIPHPGNLFEYLNYILRKTTIKNSNAIHLHDVLFQSIVEQKYPEIKEIYIIPHGSVAGRYMKYKKKLEKQNNILFFGRIEKYKGLDYLIQAMKYVDPSIKLIIAGTGSLAVNIKEEDRERIIIKNYFISDEEAAYLLETSRLLVLPYIQASQSSLPQIAQEFNLPVVGTDVGTLGIEIKKGGGLVVPPLDTIKLAEAINKLLQKPLEEVEFIKNDKNFEYLASKFLDMYINIYENKSKEESNKY